MKAVLQLLLLSGLVVIANAALSKGQYLTPQAFLDQSFLANEGATESSVDRAAANNPLVKDASVNYKARSIWLDTDDKQRAKDIFNRDYAGFRVRYWQQGSKTAWIMDEIGKTQPITMGVVIVNNQIEKVSILEFRESRGGEIRHPFFTQQFIGLSLQHDAMTLSDSIDGITGATLSVRAAIRVARFALYLNDKLLDDDETVNTAVLSGVGKLPIDEKELDQ